MPDDGARGDPTRGDGAIDFDRAWQELLASLTETSPAPAGDVSAESTLGAAPEPAPELRAEPEDAADDESDDAAVAVDDGHFEPPPPPPLPRLRGVTVVAVAAMLAGVLVLALQIDGGGLAWLGVLAIVAGAASLVYHMRSGPPTDSGWDDGAVL